jgi:hypothetical protein
MPPKRRRGRRQATALSYEQASGLAAHDYFGAWDLGDGEEDLDGMRLAYAEIAEELEATHAWVHPGTRSRSFFTVGPGVGQWEHPTDGLTDREPQWRCLHRLGVLSTDELAYCLGLPAEAPEQDPLYAPHLSQQQLQAWWASR